MWRKKKAPIRARLAHHQDSKNLSLLLALHVLEHDPREADMDRHGLHRFGDGVWSVQHSLFEYLIGRDESGGSARVVQTRRRVWLQSGARADQRPYDPGVAPVMLLPCVRRSLARQARK